MLVSATTTQADTSCSCPLKCSGPWHEVLQRVPCSHQECNALAVVSSTVHYIICIVARRTARSWASRTTSSDCFGLSLHSFFVPGLHWICPAHSLYVAMNLAPPSSFPNGGSTMHTTFYIHHGLRPKNQQEMTETGWKRFRARLQLVQKFSSAILSDSRPLF